MLNSNVLLCRGETWVARLDGHVVGFLTLIGDDLDQLYLRPGYYRRGIGSLLLTKAKERSAGRLHLFTFQRNERARAFYEAHGFRIVNLSDGSRNEEGEPTYCTNGWVIRPPQLFDGALWYRDHRRQREPYPVDTSTTTGRLMLASSAP